MCCRTVRKWAMIGLFRCIATIDTASAQNIAMIVKVNVHIAISAHGIVQHCCNWCLQHCLALQLALTALFSIAIGACGFFKKMQMHWLQNIFNIFQCAHCQIFEIIFQFIHVLMHAQFKTFEILWLTWNASQPSDSPSQILLSTQLAHFLITMWKQLKLASPIPAVVSPIPGRRGDVGQFKRFFFQPVEGEPVHWICKKCK